MFFSSWAASCVSLQDIGPLSPPYAFPSISLSASASERFVSQVISFHMHNGSPYTGYHTGNTFVSVIVDCLNIPLSSLYSSSEKWLEGVIFFGYE
jgi:hypothetical protein